MSRVPARRTYTQKLSSWTGRGVRQWHPKGTAIDNAMDLSINMNTPAHNNHNFLPTSSKLLSFSVLPSNSTSSRSLSNFYFLRLSHSHYKFLTNFHSFPNFSNQNAILHRFPRSRRCFVGLCPSSRHYHHRGSR
ncbi:hypothetical protein AA313_de0209403 [Arthrobotrys entomopaga]|nr:hypothetical protein AA313_de0209403 [Arthrobotrys entomopaga]